MRRAAEWGINHGEDEYVASRTPIDRSLGGLLHEWNPTRMIRRSCVRKNDKNQAIDA